MAEKPKKVGPRPRGKSNDDIEKELYLNEDSGEDYLINADESDSDSSENDSQNESQNNSAVEEELLFNEIVELFNKLDVNYSEPVHLVEDPDGETDEMATFDNEMMVIELLFAAFENDVPGIRQLVARSIPVHAGDYDLRTALHLAAAEGSLQAVKYLVEHGHPLNVRERWGATPLDEAKREKRDSVVKYLSSLKK